MADAVRLTLVHHHPGRLRLRGEWLRAPLSAAARSLVQGLGALPGMGQVQHSGQTGSVLCEYPPGELTAEAILEALGDLGIEVVEPTGERWDVAGAVYRVAHGANEVVRELTDQKADLKLLAPVGLAAWGVAQLVRSPVPVRWDNLLWWSYSLFTQLNHPHKPEPSEKDRRP
jgi:hypothetical protein